MGTKRFSRGALGAATCIALLAANPVRAAQTDEKAMVPGTDVRYAPAENRNIRVSVDQVVLAGSKEYLPKDKHWLQLRVMLTNKGSGTLSFSGLRERLPDGTVLDAATSSADVNKPPSMAGMYGKQFGIGTAAMAAGYLVAPPLALIGSVAGGFGTMLGLDKGQKRQRQINETILKATPIAPGTSVAAWAYVPALKEHNGLIVFYSLDGKLESLPIQRLGHAAPIPVASAAAPAEEAGEEAAAAAPGKKRKPARARRK
jgi:hypothetical protein